MFDQRIINGDVFRNGSFEKTNIYITGEKIVLISPDFLHANVSIDATNKKIIPGLIDPHTHFDLDLGFIRSSDDFEHGSIAAIYGGVTTIVDFLAPSSNTKELIESYELRLKEALLCHIDYKFHATIYNPTGDLEEYVQTVLKLGMNTIKLFTTYSDSNRRTYDKEIIKLLQLSEKYKVIIHAHIENDEAIVSSPNQTFHELSMIRNTNTETSEALKLASFVRTYGGYLYMVHLSSGETLKKLKESYNDILNKRFFVESCPQYFALTNELLSKDNGYLYTFAPPLRNYHELTLLKDNVIDVFAIGTDHCPFQSKDKFGLSLKGMPLGIGGIEHSFRLMHHLFHESVIDKMTRNPAFINQLNNKGIIKEGYDADLCIYLETNCKIEENHSTSDYSVYTNFPVSSKITDVFLRGHHTLSDQKLYLVKGQLIKE